MSPMRYVLFPGRHHLITVFQVNYLSRLLAGGELDAAGERVEMAADAMVVWAVTSATHSGTRRNPLPAHRREALIERVTTTARLPSLVALVPDVPPSGRFATTTLGHVEQDTGRTLTPANTIVACSTPQVAVHYERLGFRIALVEATDPTNPPARPWEVLERMVAGDPTWQVLAHEQTRAYYDLYHLDDAVRLIHTDPTVSADGDLTETRDYGTYTAAFDDASDRKYAQVAPLIVPGRVVDLGCAAGGLLERAAADPRLAESDLFGVDVSRHLIDEAEHRKAQGRFANPNVYFTQRNLLRSAVFPPGTVNTTLTLALTHEISSYGAGRADLELLAKRIFEHTAPGGVWVNSDVLGPDGGDEVVHLTFDTPPTTSAVPFDGWERATVGQYIASLSPADRLVQFTADFPALSGAPFEVTWSVDGRSATLTRRDAMEFLYTRDYTDNWLSECHERFCDMTYADWVELVTVAGFEVAPGSGPWRNDWLVDNRLSVGVDLRDADGRPGRWPNTHVLMVARRPH